MRGYLETGIEKVLSACQDTLTHLYIEDCDNLITDKTLWLVSGYCRLLSGLTYRSRVDLVSGQLMWALGMGCPGITELYVQPLHPCAVKSTMNNKFLQIIGQFYKGIQGLGIGGKELTMDGLLPL